MEQRVLLLHLVELADNLVAARPELLLAEQVINERLDPQLSKKVVANNLRVLQPFLPLHRDGPDHRQPKSMAPAPDPVLQPEALQRVHPHPQLHVPHEAGLEDSWGQRRPGHYESGCRFDCLHVEFGDFLVAEGL
jgi:hypothetical protein